MARARSNAQGPTAFWVTSCSPLPDVISSLKNTRLSLYSLYYEERRDTCLRQAPARSPIFGRVPVSQCVAALPFLVQNAPRRSRDAARLASWFVVRHIPASSTLKLSTERQFITLENSPSGILDEHRVTLKVRVRGNGHSIKQLTQISVVLWHFPFLPLPLSWFLRLFAFQCAFSSLSDSDCSADHQ